MARNVLVDAGFLVALLSHSDSRHNGRRLKRLATHEKRLPVDTGLRHLVHYVLSLSITLSGRFVCLYGADRLHQ